MRATRDFKCQTEGCGQKAWAWITKTEDDHKRMKHVCNDCRDELIATDDWEREDW